MQNALNANFLLELGWGFPSVFHTIFQSQFRMSFNATFGIAHYVFYFDAIPFLSLD